MRNTAAGEPPKKLVPVNFRHEHSGLLISKSAWSFDETWLLLNDFRIPIVSQHLHQNIVK